MDEPDLTIEEAEKQLSECNCRGTMATPWNYCDDCQDARDRINSPFDKGYDQEEAQEEEFKRGELMVDEAKEGNR